MKKQNLMRLIMNTQNKIVRPSNLPEGTQNYNFEESVGYSKKIENALNQKEDLKKKMVIKDLKKEEISKIQSFKGIFFNII